MARVLIRARIPQPAEERAHVGSEHPLIALPCTPVRQRPEPVESVRGAVAANLGPGPASPDRLQIDNPVWPPLAL
ncbi:MAG TPA: hypothetical protein VND54_04440 [Candidatus Saccharimonadales bacterium]|nr:hypothetical protein [Candidatus Saccharimonadales bacterium]